MWPYELLYCFFLGLKGFDSMVADLLTDTLYWCFFRMQQSSAFKILRTRLKTVPAQTFMNSQPSSSSSSSTSSTDFGLNVIRRTASAGPFAQILANNPTIPGVSQGPSEDGVLSADSSNGPSGINFVTQLQQFEHMQHQHRNHRLAQSQTKKLSRKPPPVPVQVGFISSL
jgi:vacuole morphology and inheritance protein 14